MPPTEGYKIRRDGSRYYMQVAAAPIRDTSGTVIGATATAIDVTARKQHELHVRQLNEELERRMGERAAQLERSEQLLTDVINHSPAVIYLKDLDGRYIVMNRRYESMFRIDNRDLAGCTQTSQRARDADALRANDRRVLATGTAVEFEEVVPRRTAADLSVVEVSPARSPGKALWRLRRRPTHRAQGYGSGAAQLASHAGIDHREQQRPHLRAQPRLATGGDERGDRAHRSELIGSLPDMNRPSARVPEDFAAQWRDLLERGMSGERFTVERSIPFASGPRQFSVSFNLTVQDDLVTGVAGVRPRSPRSNAAEEEARQHQAELRTCCACTRWARWR